MGWLIVVAIFAAFGLRALILFVYHKRRRAELANDAKALGLNYFTDLPEKDWARFQRFERYSYVGETQKVRFALVVETDSTRITLCEYDYDPDGESNESSTLLLVQDKRLNIPQFTLCKRTCQLEIFGFSGFEGVEFPEDPEFNSIHMVRGESPKAIREFLNSKRRKIFMRRAFMYFEGFEDGFIIDEPRVYLKATDLKDHVDQSLWILNELL